MFGIASKETKALNWSQFVIGSQKHREPGNAYASSDLGVFMFSSVLNSKQAAQMNLILRSFVNLPEVIVTHSDIST